ncbi:MAG: hypothetical protein AAGD25_27060 [Cyanobacteria bacterium P01_F01_bin.150]
MLRKFALSFTLVIMLLTIAGGNSLAQGYEVPGSTGQPTDRSSGGYR